MLSPEECAVIFDVDGVIVDTAAYHYQAFVEFGKEAGYTITEQQFRATFGCHNRDIFALLFGRSVPDDELAGLAARKEQVFRDILRRKVLGTPGVVDLVSGLKDQGFLLAIGSSTPLANIELVLGELGIRGLFSAIVSAEDVTRGKPDPQVFLLAAERLRVAPGRCVVIEDAVVGLQAALRAGMKAVAVTTNHSRAALREAHRVVDSLAELSPADFFALLG